jgi:hypothetical protein
LSAIVGILGENVKKIYIIVALCIIIAAIAIGSVIIFRPTPTQPPTHACGAIVTLKSPTDTEEADNFLPSESVYAKGSGMRKNATYKIYIITDTAIIEGMAIPTPVVTPPVTVTTNPNGAFSATVIWSPTLTPGAYDIIADCQTSGVPGYYDDADAIDDEETHVTAGFFVIPEAVLGTIGALSAAFAAAFLKYRKAF